MHDYAQVKLNGKELEGHAWQPYRWEVTNVVKPGSNDLEVEVRTSAGGRGGFGAPPPAPAAAPGARRAAAAAGAAGGKARREPRARQPLPGLLRAEGVAAMRRLRPRAC